MRPWPPRTRRRRRQPQPQPQRRWGLRAAPRSALLCLRCSNRRCYRSGPPLRPGGKHPSRTASARDSSAAQLRGSAHAPSRAAAAAAAPRRARRAAAAVRRRLRLRRAPRRQRSAARSCPTRPRLPQRRLPACVARRQRSCMQRRRANPTARRAAPQPRACLRKRALRKRLLQRALLAAASSSASVAVQCRVVLRRVCHAAPPKTHAHACRAAPQGAGRRGRGWRATSCSSSAQGVVVANQGLE